MFSGISSERILNKSIDTLTKERNLKLKRRNELFQGKWLFPTRDNRFFGLDIYNSTIRVVNLIDAIDSIDNYSIIPGMDIKGNSILSEILYEVNNPGSFIKEISILTKKLSSGEQIDINWNRWLTKYFQEEGNSNLNKESIAKLKELKSVLSQAEEINISMTDVVMFAQFLDVARELKIDLNM